VGVAKSSTGRAAREECQRFEHPYCRGGASNCDRPRFLRKPREAQHQAAANYHAALPIQWRLVSFIRLFGGTGAPTSRFVKLADPLSVPPAFERSRQPCVDDLHEASLRHEPLTQREHVRVVVGTG
jgi:hypothetical protein